MEIFPLLGLVFIGYVIWGMFRPDPKRAQAQETPAQKQKALDDWNERFDQSLGRARAGDGQDQYDHAWLTLSAPGGRSEQIKQAAAHWFGVAARNGHVGAQFEYAKALERASGVERDLAQALRWYAHAARGGHQEAEGYRLRLAKDVAKENDELLERAAFNCTEAEWPQWKALLDRCESPPERVLLKALIAEFRCSVEGERCVGDVTIKPQAQILRFRVDFLINDRLVVEVDGKQYHGSGSAFEQDRQRDQQLQIAGFQPVRFPASQVLRDANACAIIVRQLTGIPRVKSGGPQLRVRDRVGSDDERHS